MFKLIRAGKRFSHIASHLVVISETRMVLAFGKFKTFQKLSMQIRNFEE
jgi:hypothetical protein